MEILAKYFDTKYPFTKITHTRKIVRAFVFNERNEIALLKIEGDDKFGHRDYYETPGGGVKEDEDLLVALKREIQEEIGVTIKDIHPLGRIIDYYNLIYRENDNHYFYCYMDKMCETSLEEYEKGLFKGIVWVNIDQAINLYKEKLDSDLGFLVGQRELKVLETLKKIVGQK